MVIGRHSDLYSQNYWFGRIDDVAIYNRALSAAELQQLSAVPLPPAVWLFGNALLGLFAISKRKAPRQSPEQPGDPLPRQFPHRTPE